MSLLVEKVVIVTGGGSGIGQAACHLYIQEGTKPGMWLSSDKASYVSGACPKYK